MFKTNVLKNFNNIFRSTMFQPMTFNRTSLYSNIMRFNFFTKIRTTENCLIKYQKFEMRSLKSKRKARSPDPTYKMKTKNALRKRMKIIGGLLDRGFKFWSPGRRHKMTNKSSSNLTDKRKPKYVASCEVRRMKRMLPYYRRKKYKH